MKTLHSLCFNIHKVVLTCIFIAGVCSSYGQSPADTIEIRKTMGTVFRLHGKNLSPRQLLDITQPNAAAYREMKMAMRNYNAGFVFGLAGGFLIGWPVGTAMGGGNPNWAMAAAGAALVGVSIPLSTAYTRHTRNAALLYNNGLKQTGFYKVDFQLGASTNGIGLRASF